MKVSKNRKNLVDKFEANKSYDPLEAIKLIKENSYVKFEESLEVAINLRIDSNKTDQNIRGVLNLPKGTGKTLRVAVMAKGDKAKEAIDAGADIVGDDDLAKKVTEGQIDFHLLIATPDMMPTIGKIGKILGPKGLMPNPKLGTVTSDISKAVNALKKGQIEIKNDKDGNLSASIGRKSFPNAKIIDNFKTFMQTIQKEKPLKIKGDFILSAFLTSSMGISYKLNIKN